MTDMTDLKTAQDMMATAVAARETEDSVPPPNIARGIVVAVALCSALVFQSCTTSPPRVDRFHGYPLGFVERGEASWYGPGFHGNKTANGEQYNMYNLTAAHKTLPLGSVAIVRSLTSGRHVTVRINDRGPFVRGRIVDLSLAGARALRMTGKGIDRVELRVIGYSPMPQGMGVLRVQIGAFAELRNARTLFAQVKGEIAGGRITRVDLPEGRRYRVQVGRFVTEAEASKAATRLDRKFDLKSIVLRDDG